MANYPQQQQGNAQQPGSLAQLIASLGPQSPVIQQSKVDPRSLAAGIQPSFAVVTFKGKTWNIRHRGMDHPLLVRDPQTGNILGSVPTIDIIIIRSAMAISKTFYLKEFVEGSFAPPDCWSTNGVVPDPTVGVKQNDNCPNCKWNKFGSSARQVGDQVIRGKRCSDNKRLSVVPAGDLKNEAYGGPMLLRLPPTTFAGLSELEGQLHMQGYHYSGVVMRCSFDHEASHPKIIFTPIRVLNDHEAQEVVALQDSPVVERILSEEAVEVTADPKQAAPPEASPPVHVPTATEVREKQAEHGRAAAATAFKPTLPPDEPTHYPHAPMADTAWSGDKPTVLQQQLPPPVEMTAEQRRIAELEAALEQAKGTAKRRTKRSTPVTPMGQPVQQPTQQVQQGATAGTPEADEGDAPADLDSRIDALLKPNGGSKP